MTKDERPSGNGTHFTWFDGRLFVLAFVGALLVHLWFFLRQEEQVELFVPLKYSKPPMGMILSQPLPSRVKVRLKGPRWRLSSILKQEISPMILDSQSLQSGVVYLDRDRVPLIHDNVKVVDMDPAFIEVHLEKVVERVIPVKVDVLSAADASVQWFTWYPRRVRIRGPASRVYTVPFIYAGAVKARPNRDKYFLKFPSLPEKVRYVTSGRGVVIRAAVTVPGIRNVGDKKTVGDPQSGSTSASKNNNNFNKLHSVPRTVSKPGDDITTTTKDEVPGASRSAAPSARRAE